MSGVYKDIYSGAKEEKKAEERGGISQNGWGLSSK